MWDAPTTFEPFPPYPINVTYVVEATTYSPRAWVDAAVTAVVTGVDNVTGQSCPALDPTFSPSPACQRAIALFVLLCDTSRRVRCHLAYPLTRW